MSLASLIETKLQDLEPIHMVLENESHMHAGPATDSHFKVVLVSNEFQAKRPVARHQMVYQRLAEELKGPVHALALHLYTPEEWQAQGGSFPESPLCQGQK